MTFLRSLPGASLMDVFRAYPDLAKPLHEFAHRLMRGPSPFTEGERELIAAFVSSLNGCGYCRASHTAVAARFGTPEGVVDQLLSDLDRADISDSLKTVFRYVKKLTEAPSRVTQADVEAMYQAGWDETALTHAALVCAYFNFMNRWVDGLGIEVKPAAVQFAADMLHRKGYVAILESLEQKRERRTSTP